MKIAVTRPQKVTLYVSPDFQKLTADAKEAAEDAATSESNAATSESNAATSAGNALTSENNASTSESNAETSADNAADDASDAELQAQSEGPFTDSKGVDFEKGAKGFAADAETARDEITNKIQTTGYSEGDLLRVDGTGKAVPISEVDVLKNINIHTKSPVIEFPTSRIYAWENPDRPNESTITETSSGHSYVNLNSSLSLNEGMIEGKSSSMSVINTGFGSTRIEGYLGVQTQMVTSAFVIGKDIDNYFEAGFTLGRIYVDKVISGVRQSLFQEFLGTNNSRSRQGRATNVIFEYLHKGRSDESALIITTPTLSRQVSELDVTSDNTTFVTKSDIAFAGLLLSGVSDRCYNFRISDVEELF